VLPVAPVAPTAPFITQETTYVAPGVRELKLPARVVDADAPVSIEGRTTTPEGSNTGFAAITVLRGFALTWLIEIIVISAAFASLTICTYAETPIEPTSGPVIVALSTATERA
jgi:hypothetical protein